MSRAEGWHWGSLWARQNRDQALRQILSDWPIDRPADWVQRVNRAQTAAEIDAIRTSIQRERPFGDEAWTKKIVTRLKLQHTMRPRGRPPGWRKKPRSTTK